MENRILGDGHERAPPLLIKGSWTIGVEEAGKARNLRLNNIENRRGLGLTFYPETLLVLQRVLLFHPSLVSFSTYEQRGLSPGVQESCKIGIFRTSLIKFIGRLR